MKKILLTTLCALMFSVASQAQSQDRLPFAKDKFYTSGMPMWQPSAVICSKTTG